MTTYMGLKIVGTYNKKNLKRIILIFLLDLQIFFLDLTVYTVRHIK